MKPALGVTEPSAIALACAKARSLTDEPVENVHVRMNSGIYKNAFTCSIPGTDKEGNEYSAALGIVCGHADRGLCVLEGVTEDDVRKAAQLIASGKITVEMCAVSSELFISAVVTTAHDTCVAELRGEHTNFCLIKRNDQVLLQKDYVPAAAKPSPISGYRVADFIEFAERADLGELEFMREAYRLNLELVQAAMDWDKCAMTKTLLRENGGLISGDARHTAQTFAGAAAEARILGIEKPAMSIAGSGTHGIICTMPLYGAARVLNLSDEKLLRATAISYLITMYIKEFSGKLSAFCGCGIAGGTGMACALAWMQGADLAGTERVVNNMAASITGMICTGGNQCCVLKVLAAVDAAFNAVTLALSGAGVMPKNGICGYTMEKTVRNIGTIASPGMQETERVILDIMMNKK